VNEGETIDPLAPDAPLIQLVRARHQGKSLRDLVRAARFKRHRKEPRKKVVGVAEVVVETSSK